MRELKQRIIMFLYRLFPQKAVQYGKDEIRETNDESSLLKGVKGSDKIKIAVHMDRKIS